MGDTSSRKSKSKDRKEHKKKSSKSSKDKKRRRDVSSDDTSDSDSGQDDKKRKSEKLALKVAAHLQRNAANAGEGPKFVWTKKVEQELESGKKVKELSAFSDRDRHAERLEEIEKVRKRQLEREAEKVRREEELEMVQRLRGHQEALESQAKEEEGYLKSLVMKARRRISENRAEPIDLIAKNLHLADDFDMDLSDPWAHFSGLMLDDAQALHRDILDFQVHDKYNSLHVAFWDALRVVADAELLEAQRRDASDRAHMRGEALPAAFHDRTLTPGVEADIEGMLSGQTHAELVALEASVEATLQDGGGDPEYYDAVLKRLQIHKAKAKVREVQAELMETHLAGLLTAANAAGTASIRDAMGWDGEDRGTVTADPASIPAGADPESNPADAAAVPGAEDIALDSEEMEMHRELGLLDEEEEEELKRRKAAAADAAAAVTEPSTSAQAPSTSAAAADAAAMPPPLSRIPTVMPPPPPPKQMFEPGGNDRRRRGEPVPEPVVQEESEEEDDETPLADGRFSPPPVDPRQLGGLEVVHEEDDYKMLELLRAQVRMAEAEKIRAAAGRSTVPSTDDGAGAGGSGRNRPTSMLPAAVGAGGRVWSNEERTYISTGVTLPGPAMDNSSEMAELKKRSLGIMGQAEAGELDYKGEVELESRHYWWHEKHKPRKPKYFNRVHTGYDWNKYNQTHYDSDNPPPKVVQGYKFNIMYHDLVDKSVAPTYTLEEDPASVDGTTCLIRFSAGPPYEDIAFRIVKKPIELAHKRGYKCTFDRGILHVYFNFERHRYRR